MDWHKTLYRPWCILQTFVIPWLNRFWEVQYHKTSIKWHYKMTLTLCECCELLDITQLVGWQSGSVSDRTVDGLTAGLRAWVNSWLMDCYLQTYWLGTWLEKVKAPDQLSNHQTAKPVKTQRVFRPCFLWCLPVWVMGCWNTMQTRPGTFPDTFYNSLFAIELLWKNVNPGF